MNSQLLPVADFSLIQDRVEERIAYAAKARALRGLRQGTGPFAAIRKRASELVVRFGQRMKPGIPEREEGDELVLLPLAR